MKLLVPLAFALVAADFAAAQCDYDFCPDGITYPTTIVNPTDPEADQATCSLVPLGIAVGQISAEQCEELPLLEFVCCPPAGPIPCGNTTIEFCANGLDDPNVILNPTDPAEDQVPCGFVYASLGLAVVPDEECATIPFAESICCPGSNETMPPMETPPPNDPPTEPPTMIVTEDTNCYFCGSNVSYNKDKGWGGVNICAEFEDLVANLSAGDFCESLITDQIDDRGLNVRSFCECEGVAAPDVCFVCPSGKELVEDREIPGTNGVTCGAGAAYIRHVTEASRCGEFVNSAAQEACCIGESGPTEESGAITLTMSGLATGFLLILASAI